MDGVGGEIGEMGSRGRDCAVRSGEAMEDYGRE